MGKGLKRATFFLQIWYVKFLDTLFALPKENPSVLISWQLVFKLRKIKEDPCLPTC